MLCCATFLCLQKTIEGQAKQLSDSCFRSNMIAMDEVAGVIFGQGRYAGGSREAAKMEEAILLTLYSAGRVSIGTLHST